MEGCCRSVFLVTITLSFLIALAEAFENCNVGYWNFFICFDDAETQGYCCDLQSDGTYLKCCYKDNPIPPYQPPANHDWFIVLVCFIILLVLSITWWCIRCHNIRRREANNRNTEAVVERSTARQAQQSRGHVQSRSNTSEPAPPSYKQVTGEGTSDEYKELLSGYLYAMPPNYQATVAATNAPSPQ